MNPEFKKLALFAIAAAIAVTIILLLHRVLPHEVTSGPQLLIAIEFVAVGLLAVSYLINEVLEIWKTASRGPDATHEGFGLRQIGLIFGVVIASYALYLAATYVYNRVNQR